MPSFVKDHTEGQMDTHYDLMLHVDGGCQPKNPGGVATSGWVVYATKKYEEPLAEGFLVAKDGGPEATNNYAEYMGLVTALKWLHLSGWRKCHGGELAIKSDSKLLVEQVNDRWKCKAHHLITLRQMAWQFLDAMNLRIVTADDPLPPEGKDVCSVTWIPRELNERADTLSNMAYAVYTGGNVGESLNGWQIGKA